MIKVVVTGTRGIPGIQGGIETHCEQLCPRLAQRGADVTVVRRSDYVGATAGLKEYKGVKLFDIASVKSKHFEAALHTLMGVLYARRVMAKVVHIHGVGPCLMAPVARFLGLKVVATSHGSDYNRDKWGSVASAIIKLGEWCMMKYSNSVIAISNEIADGLVNEYGYASKVHVIPNGVNEPPVPQSYDYLNELGLTPGEYVVAVARFVPEKRLDMLVDAFGRISTCGKKLVLVGDSDIDDQYSRDLKAKAREAGAVLTGFIKGDKLAQVMSAAALFVLPSTHEGLSISLLEAMSYGLDVLVSDIKPNMLPELDPLDHFHVDNMDSLCNELYRKISKPAARRTYNMTKYSWDQIAIDTIMAYRAAEVDYYTT